ncbi:carbohydrate ABC transporter permease [uncultured Sphaerochaeta sp.]|uniref:carbohydrate ABC transporter permease n=1 Tax=uncultured Sphaerochaeta sp. TaxID=886478 RepID=UPI002A0A0EE7|nr:carbohydrate ABC transporter permease [uncultured Sphaerochaeta sp.]
MKFIRKRKIIEYSIFNVFNLFIIFLFLFPIILAINTAFKTPLETANSVLAFPSSIYFKNFTEGMRKSNFTQSLINSVTVTFPSVVLIVFFSSMSGYSIARNGHWSKLIKSLDKVYLSSLMIPFQILMIPVYKMFKNLGLLNSLFGMILMFTGNSIAYATFLYVGFIKSIPLEVEDAATIDGCTPFQTFRKIVFPLLAPVSATVAALHIMWLWNDFNISIILLQKDTVRTLTVKQYYFFGAYSAEYGMAFAAAILSMMPVIICFLFMQRYLVAGISSGAIKN